MSLEEKINAEIKAAMLAKEKEKLEALRGIKAAILLEKTKEGGSAGLTPDTEIKMLQKMVKQRKESADIYKQQNRSDLYEKEMFEASVIQLFLPAQMSEAELETIIREIIVSTGASGVKDMGKVMGQATARIAGRVEGKLLAAKVRQLLG